LLQDVGCTSFSEQVFKRLSLKLLEMSKSYVEKKGINSCYWSSFSVVRHRYHSVCVNGYVCGSGNFSCLLRYR